MPKPLDVVTRLKRIANEWRRGVPFVVLNFHRIEAAAQPSIAGNPFTHLSAVTASHFRTTLQLCKTAFEIVSIDNLTEPTRHKQRLALTFDDVPTSFVEHALPILEDLQLPVTLFPSVAHLENGSGWRDLIYFAIERPAIAERITQRVQQQWGADAAATLRERGLYRWSKSSNRADKLVSEILLPAIGDDLAQFHELVARHRPYLNWQQLSTLAQHPLITIGSHGASHFDYSTLSNSEIRNDVATAQAAFTEHLGRAPSHFALPFGGVEQRVWQTLDSYLPTLGIKTASWCAPYGNPTPRAESRLQHISRINCPTTIRSVVAQCSRAMARPIANYTATFPYQRLAGQGGFDFDISDDEYQRFYGLLFPQKKVHQQHAYFDYCYGKNPFRNDKPAHVGLHYEGNLEAILSMFWSPFSLFGKQINGSYMAGWWRLPQIHSEIGTRPFLPMIRSVSPIVGGYKTSPDTRRLFERDGWSLVALHRYEGSFAKAKARARAERYQATTTYPAAITSLLDETNATVSLSIWRDQRYYTWRYENYPLTKYTYLFDPAADPAWMAMVAVDLSGTALYLSDVVARRRDSEPMWEAMLAAVADYMQTTTAKRIVVETTNTALIAVLTRLGIRRTKSFINSYFVNPDLLANPHTTIYGAGMHETQSCGDALPK